MYQSNSLALYAAAGALVLAVLATTPSTQAQGTAFSYQGRLNTNGTPAAGVYDLKFTIYDALVSGNIQGGPVTNSAVGVTNGLFAVALDFGSGSFTGPGRWLDIAVRTNGTGAFTSLGQRQPVLATPYSVFAGTASNVVSGAVVKSLNGLRDNVSLAAGANVTVTPSGNTLTIASTGGSSIWSLNGSSAYYTGGNVGIGTSTPVAALDLTSFNGNALLYMTAPRPNLIFRDQIAGNARGVIGGWGGGLRFYAESFENGSDSTALMTYDTNGNLTIGSGNTPQARVDISAPRNVLRLSGSRPNLIFLDTDIGYRSGIEAQGGDVTLTTEGYISGVQPNNFAVLRGNGSFCIGTRAADANLNVANVSSYNTGLKLSGSAVAGTGLALENTSAGGHKYAVLSGGSGDGIGAGGFGVFDDTAGAYRLAISAAGNVGIGTYAPVAKLDVAGNTRTCSLTITAGCDLAEPFPLESDEIPKGSVVVIDREHPGKLKRSTRRYDKRVAGIISGANGINPGISLQQDGVFDAGQNVALSGRVYVLADAANGAIEPGDLLTTSDTPGHAMKASDYSKAQGAILGKAMSPLTDGQGMVLVLVTLQ